MSAKPCKGCGKPIVFGKDKDTGKWQVLSNSAPIWRQVGTEKGVPIVVRDTSALLSHFVNCPNANQFSAGKKPPEPERHFSEPDDIA